MANPRAFFDSNILLYTDDPRDPAKQKASIELIKKHQLQRTGAVSIQVLGEYFQNARRKMNLDVPTARARVRFFSNLLSYQPNIEDVLAAIDLYHWHDLNYWDAMIVRAAIQSGCRTLYSEDMQHRQKIQNVEIVNPFL